MGWLVAAFEGRLAAALAFEPAQREFDVLAGPEGVGGEIAAGAKVVAQVLAADQDLVGALALGIADLELGEDLVLAEVLEAELLVAAELPAQLDLPVFE